VEVALTMSAEQEPWEDAWFDRDTTPGKVEAAMREMLAARHHESHAFVPARVLNQIVIVDREFKGEIENRLERVGRYHPSRLIICAVSERHEKLEASVQIDTSQAAGPGEIAVGRECIVLHIGRQHLKALDTIVGPLLVSDLATVVWAPHGHREGVDALRRLTQIVLLDSQDERTVAEGLDRAADLAANVYVVDLAWLRSTPWRERIAAAFDPPAERSSLRKISSVTVRHRDDSLAAAVLFCGWLSTRLGWKPESLAAASGRLTGHARAPRQEVRITLEPTDQSAPGLAGVTIETASGEAVALDRSSGGLRSLRRARDGSERTWTVLGASRGEAGILGEGVRQALLRDPTYGPALRCARTFVS
jgi:glucose-6-phosphate dehydrogenase assembly protein OpcA